MATEQDLVAEIAQIVEIWGEELTEKIRESLQAKGNNASGVLGQSFQPEVTVGSDHAIFRLRAEDYYLFPDKGRQPGRGVGKMVAKMSGANGWIAHKGIPPKMSVIIKRKMANGSVKQSIKTYKNIAEANVGAAWAIAMFIKKHGYRGTNYYSDVVNAEAFLDLRKRIVEKTANPDFIFKFIDPNQ